AGDDDERGQREAAVGPGKDDRDERGRDERGADRHERAEAIGDPAEADVVQRPECTRDEPRRPDRDRAEAERRQAKRREHGAPVHENALAIPWQRRARSSSQGTFATPKIAVVTATTIIPTSTVGLTPIRAATTPLGIEPTSAPAGYAAASTPAPALPSPSMCA